MRQRHKDRFSLKINVPAGQRIKRPAFNAAKKALIIHYAEEPLELGIVKALTLKGSTVILSGALLRLAQEKDDAINTAFDNSDTKTQTEAARMVVRLLEQQLFPVSEPVEKAAEVA